MEFEADALQSAILHCSHLSSRLVFGISCITPAGTELYHQLATLSLSHCQLRRQICPGAHKVLHAIRHAYQSGSQHSAQPRHARNRTCQGQRHRRGAQLHAKKVMRYIHVRKHRAPNMQQCQGPHIRNKTRVRYLVHAQVLALQRC